MKEVEQVGSDDCFAACVASIFELPLSDIPNFVGDRGPQWFSGLLAWLEPRGYSALFVDFSEECHRPRGYSILSAWSVRGPFNHAVVALNGKVVWDPSPLRHQGIGGWRYWTVITALDPSMMRTTLKFSPHCFTLEWDRLP